MKMRRELLSVLIFPLMATQSVKAQVATEEETEKVEAKASEEQAEEKESAAEEAAATEEASSEAPAEAAPAVKLDFGDHSSQTLTSKAWASLSASNHEAVAGYTGKCIEMFEKQAIEMQAKLTAPAPAATANDYWALNDVATCYLVRAQSKEAKGDTDGALADYKVITEKLSYGQCWDVKGWFWKPADAAKVKLKELAYDSAE